MVYLMFFAHDEAGLCISGRKTRQVKCHCHHIMSRVHTASMAQPVDVNLHHLAETVSVGLLPCNATPFPLSVHCTLWEECTMCSTHLRSGNQLHLLEGGVSTYIQNSAQEICLFCPINLYIQSIIFISMNSRIFILYSELQSNIILFCCSNSFSLGQLGTLISVGSCVFNMLPKLCKFFFFQTLLKIECSSFWVHLMFPHNQTQILHAQTKQHISGIGYVRVSQPNVYYLHLLLICDVNLETLSYFSTFLAMQMHSIEKHLKIMQDDALQISTQT